MSHPAVLVLVRDRSVHGYMDRWAGARLLDYTMFGGPSQVDDAVTDLDPLTRLDGDAPWEAGALVDWPQKRVLWFGDPTTEYAGEEPRGPCPTQVAWSERVRREWPNWGIEKVEGTEDFRAHLAAQQISLASIHVKAQAEATGSEPNGAEAAEEARGGIARNQGPSPVDATRGRSLGCAYLVLASPLLLAAIIVRLFLVLVPSLRASLRGRRTKAFEARAKPGTANGAPVAVTWFGLFWMLAGLDPEVDDD